MPLKFSGWIFKGIFVRLIKGFLEKTLEAILRWTSEELLWGVHEEVPERLSKVTAGETYERILGRFYEGFSGVISKRKREKVFCNNRQRIF